MDTDRRSLGWTYRKLAAEADRSEATVCKFFKGVSKSPVTAKQLALAMGHPVSRYVLESRTVSAA